GLRLAPKGTTYGNREPRGDAPVAIEELMHIVQRLREHGPRSGTAADAVRALRPRPAVAEALLARIEISCAYRADDLNVSELTSATSHLGDFETHSVVGGNQRLAEALASELQEPVALNTPVKRIHWGNGVIVHTAGGALEADAAVIAVPARVLQEIEFEPAL